MAPTTRSKAEVSGLKSASQEPTRKLPTAASRKASKTSRSTTAPEESTQQLLVPRPRRKPNKPSRIVPAPPSEESTRALPGDAIVHWPCRRCSCPQGAFIPPVNACIFCEHDIDTHELPQMDTYWNPYCDNVSEREELVAATLRLALEKRVVVIRATPQVGKTTLLLLLGRHILFEHPSLEPVFVYWQRKEERNGVEYQAYLESEASAWRKINATYRCCNPDARLIYLIDEAQNSYSETDFWARSLKNMSTRSSPLFILVCVYGSAGKYLNGRHSDNVLSESIKLDPSQRIELRRPAVAGGLCMLFTTKETTTVVNKWAIYHGYNLSSGVVEYIQMTTDGHPGIVSFMLDSFVTRFKHLDSSIQSSMVWTPEFCHATTISPAGIIVNLQSYGRGVWDNAAEDFAQHALRLGKHGNIRFSDVVRVMQSVAAKRSGYTRSQIDYDAFAFCHKMGFLHTEPSVRSDDNEITYVFASPIHRRLAYMRLLPGLDQDAAPDDRTLLQTCLDAIKKISPSAMQNRRVQSDWSIPEATFQDEMYCCLDRELRHLPILSEYAHMNGRVDFFVYDKKWGIEVLQSGSKPQIIEHMARFGPEGKYRKWNLLNDYIVLNFCPKSKLQELEIQDSELQSRILQVVIDPRERIAEIYTYDMQLMADFTLSEGRNSPSAGTLNLEMAPNGSNTLTSSGNGHVAGALYERDDEEVRGMLEEIRSRGFPFNEAALLQMPAQEVSGFLARYLACSKGP